MAKNVIVLDIVGLEYDHLNSGLLPNISQIANEGESAKMEPVFPSVTCTVQASILTGNYPDEHGIISNGLYDKTNYVVSFWEQSSRLVHADRVWDIAKRKNPSIKTAALFFQNTMFANSDVIVTPRPLHMEEGMITWCYSKPVGYYDEELILNLGEFNLGSYWGPFASSKSSEWIVKAAEYTLEKQRPNLMFVYVPHLDYSAQRFGKNSSQVRDDLKKADELLGRLIQKTMELGINEDTQFIILSEYGFNDVRNAIPLNLKLRDSGLLAVRTINNKEYIDYENSKAFAMVDHQIAHVYIREDFRDKTKSVLANTQGVEKIIVSSEEKKELRIDNERTGDIIAISDRDKWFSYYWWYLPEKAPNFSRTVDIHRKPGYDPLELFLDPTMKSISHDPTLVKGSHGRPADPASGEGLSFYASNKKSGLLTSNSGVNNPIKCVNIGKHLIDMVS